MENLYKRFISWIDERFPWTKLVNWGLNEEIVGGTSFFYTLGSLLLFLFAIQVFTGIWQMFFFAPTVDNAYNSLNYLRLEVPFGWLIHGLHYWGANAFVVVIGLHIIRVFTWGAYKSPRELVWLSGFTLLLIVAAFMFTGPILPWDKTGYWAAKVGMSIAGSVPIVGALTLSFLQGSSQLGQSTLTRMYGAHVLVIPALAALLIVAHVIAFRQHSSVGPWKEEKQKATGLFWPNQVFKDTTIIFFVFIVLVGLTVFIPAPFHGMADPDDTFLVPKPDWSFLFLYQTLKYFKGVWEPLGVVGVPIFIILLFVLLPFADRNKERDPIKRPFVIICGILMVIYFLAMTFMGAYSDPSAGGGAPSSSVASSKPVENKKPQTPTPSLGLPAVPPVPAAPPAAPQPTAGSVAGGEQLFNALGCTACHSANGQPNDKAGPDLILALTPAQNREWLHTQIVNPKAHNPQTIMPAYNYLTSEKLSDLLDFLQFLGKQKANVPTPFSQSPKPQPLGAQNKVVKPSPESTALRSDGETLFDTAGCVACHTANGAPSGKIGPDLVLSMAKEKRSADWLRAQLESPKTHSPSSVMPSYSSLGATKISALVDFISGLTKKTVLQKSKGQKIQPNTVEKAPAAGQLPEKQGPGVTADAKLMVGDWHHGELLFGNFCAVCHGPGGDINSPGFFKKQGVPPLNPIAEDRFDNEPSKFVENIDPLLQHGTPNEGGGPDMPAFGDEHNLTQPQIADVEAYVLKLNKVDRTKINDPGMAPRDFFFILLEMSILLAALLLILKWSKKILK
jgi:ubiquinol-cytochrome c reductase cytochrome b subunit